VVSSGARRRASCFPAGSAPRGEPDLTVATTIYWPVPPKLHSPAEGRPLRKNARLKLARCERAILPYRATGSGVGWI